MKSEFMAIASHELRTPIAIIKGYTDLLVAGVLGPLSDEQRSKLLRINSNAKHLNQMVSDIMDLTRMDSGEMKFHKSKFSLRKLVKNHVLDVTQLANEKKIKVDFKADVNSLVFADRSRVTQVIVNLTDNALKFTPVGGMIKIRISEGVKNFSISVSDSGIGIPKHEQKHIFERFYQVDSSYQRKFKGVGLGLAISQRIVEYHGGKIRIDSVPNSGTKVTFTLPKAF